MEISKDEIAHVAKLARINIDESQIDEFSEQIKKILQYINILNKVDTEGVEPVSHVIPIVNAFRDDEVKNDYSKDDLLANAPEEENGAFIVPKVI